MERNTILIGDVIEQLRTLPDGSVQTCVTSPPYFGLRDYGGQRRWFGGELGCDHDRIACLMDNVRDGRAVTYDQHRKLERTTGWHRVQDNADE